MSSVCFDKQTLMVAHPYRGSIDGSIDRLHDPDVLVRRGPCPASQQGTRRIMLSVPEYCLRCTRRSIVFRVVPFDGERGTCFCLREGYLRSPFTGMEATSVLGAKA